MNERTTVFIDEVAEQVKSGSMKNDSGQPHSPLAALMELSNQAVSHLQFQDPMSQKLNSIISDLDASKERVRRALNGEDCEDPAHSAEVPPVAEDVPHSGEIMLF